MPIQHNKKRLIILSDLWGREKSQWLSYYTDELASNFDIKYYDSCDLAQVNKSNYTEKALHKQFVNGGIDRAVNQLLSLEKDPVNILAFSIGGTIAWKFGLKSELINSLYGVSATRLRYETTKPAGEIQLHFGSEDDYAPANDWFDTVHVDYHSHVNGTHTLYTDKLFAAQLSEQIKQNTITGQHDKA